MKFFMGFFVHINKIIIQKIYSKINRILGMTKTRSVYILIRYYQSSYFFFLFKRRSIRRGPPECPEGSGFIQENILDNRIDSLVHTKDKLSLFCHEV